MGLYGDGYLWKLRWAKNDLFKGWLRLFLTVASGRPLPPPWLFVHRIQSAPDARGTRQLHRPQARDCESAFLAVTERRDYSGAGSRDEVARSAALRRIAGQTPHEAVGVPFPPQPLCAGSLPHVQSTRFCHLLGCGSCCGPGGDRKYRPVA